MAVDLQAIDAKIRKFQKLRELLADEETRELMADPEVLELVRSTVPKNGSNKNDASTAPLTLEFPDEAEDENLPAEGSLKRKVLEAARACTGKFDTSYIVQQLNQAGQKFNNRDPKLAVNQALRGLTKKKFIRLVREGSGRIPNIYEARKKESETERRIISR